MNHELFESKDNFYANFRELQNKENKSTGKKNFWYAKKISEKSTGSNQKVRARKTWSSSKK